MAPRDEAEDDGNLIEIRSIAGRLLPGSGDVAVQRTERGGSTPVYRLQRSASTFYLRLGERPEASLVPEARVHDILRVRGVHVPDVVHLEPFNPRLRRSVMVTTEIAGEPIAMSQRGVDLESIVEAAGRDLATINSVAVSGFGWIRRDLPDEEGLRAELPDLRAFALDGFESHLSLASALLSVAEIESLRDVMTRNGFLLDSAPAVLAHGDFDASHIYHRNGEYTGIIDFGEIRGTDRFYDLGHFALHDGESLPQPLLPALLRGCRQVSELPPDTELRITAWSLLIGLRALARNVQRPTSAYRRHLIVALKRALDRC